MLKLDTEEWDYLLDRAVHNCRRKYDIKVPNSLVEKGLLDCRYVGRTPCFILTEAGYKLTCELTADFPKGLPCQDTGH